MQYIPGQPDEVAERLQARPAAGQRSKAEAKGHLRGRQVAARNALEVRRAQQLLELWDKRETWCKLQGTNDDREVRVRSPSSTPQSSVSPKVATSQPQGQPFAQQLAVARAEDQEHAIMQKCIQAGSLRKALIWPATSHCVTFKATPT